MLGSSNMYPTNDLFSSKILNVFGFAFRTLLLTALLGRKYTYSSLPQHVPSYTSQTYKSL